MNLTHEQALDLGAGYVLGALDAEEERAVREHLAGCPEPHGELESLGSVAQVLAVGVEAVEPPAALKGRILAAAAADLEARRVRPAVPEPGPAVGIDPPPALRFPTPEEREGRTAERAERIRDGRAGVSRTLAGRRTPASAWLFRVAAVVAIVALAGWNVVLQRDLGTARDYQAGVAAVLALANAPGGAVAALNPTDTGRPNGLVAVGADGRVAIVLRDLGPTTGAEVYEAWVILPGNEGPIPIGGFTPSANGTATFLSGRTDAVAGATVALTKEPGPGATTPTLPILSVGATTAQPGS